MERVIDCPVCFDTDNCFEDIQENYNSYLCFHCGFMSDSRYQLDSLETIENMKNAPIKTLFGNITIEQTNVKKHDTGAGTPNSFWGPSWNLGIMLID